MTKKRKSSYRATFVSELDELAVTMPAVLAGVRRRGMKDDWQLLELDLHTSQMVPAAAGLKANAVETVIVALSRSPLDPPQVFVTHDRFVGTPHVLTGGELCIYLDPASEWNPMQGAVGFVDRLYRWFTDAVADQFDARTALWHVVGGRAHFTLTEEVVVCKHDLPLAKRLSFAWLTRLGERKLLLSPDPVDGEDAEQVLVVQAHQPMFLGPGRTLEQVLGHLGTGLARQATDAWLKRAVRRKNQGRSDVHIVLAIPNDAAGTHHLQVGQVQLADLARGLWSHVDVPIEWRTVMDERPSISTRRDVARPVTSLAGRDVALLGCGGLGSWIAEFMVRAGVRSIDLADPGLVSPGLLVRQNYVEGDVAYPKANSIAQRLQMIAPECSITTATDGTFSRRLIELLAEEGAVVIDATVSLAVAQVLNGIAQSEERKATIAQVLTDTGTGSLGMMAVSALGSTTTYSLDLHAKEIVLSDGALEAYRTFWEEREKDELIPALGCSIPTFHGSSADMAAVAAMQVNLLGKHLTGGTSGVHLFALPHSGVQPALRFIRPPSV